MTRIEFSRSPLLLCFKALGVSVLADSDTRNKTAGKTAPLRYAADPENPMPGRVMSQLGPYRRKPVSECDVLMGRLEIEVPRPEKRAAPEKIALEYLVRKSSGSITGTSHPNAGQHRNTGMTEEEKELFDAYKSETEKCWDIAQRLDVANPEISGAFTGTPSERINRQLQYMQEFAE